ncbi:MAG TPA: hypothetical protein VGL03_15165 [Thermoanaerobaculia bacterium]
MPKVGFPLRQGAPFLAALLFGAINSSGCKESGSLTQGKATPTAPPVTAAPTPNPTPTLHAWANPITIAGIRFADHTWVTAYDAPSMCPPVPAYWYSWGGCHATGSGTTATALASHEADLPVARCICQPDVEDYLPSPGNPAHGGIDIYGITGVCHQLSNRILFATAGGAARP